MNSASAAEETPSEGLLCGCSMCPTGEQEKASSTPFTRTRGQAQYWSFTKKE
ncbi:Protein phosphatase PP2A regulatory subunit B [Giardia duodenalis]|uniref:Protein phosphatase PP2A regulatory subunit B n=1 Tax=Giardia intestinalis TaxID=5741 RepID=V6TNP7_GIAIN|nr:Protein phosphatase PP2A regulatory subunit B [Giardia intestinalis]